MRANNHHCWRAYISLPVAYAPNPGNLRAKPSRRDARHFRNARGNIVENARKCTRRHCQNAHERTRTHGTHLVHLGVHAFKRPSLLRRKFKAQSALMPSRRVLVVLVRSNGPPRCASPLWCVENGGLFILGNGPMRAAAIRCRQVVSTHGWSAA